MKKKKVFFKVNSKFHSFFKKHNDFHSRNSEKKRETNATFFESINVSLAIFPSAESDIPPSHGLH